MTESIWSAGRPEQALALVRSVLARATPGKWGSPTWVGGWVENGGGAIRVVYDQVGEDRRLGYRSELKRGYRVDVGASLPEAVDFVTDAIGDPLGRQGDLLVEEQGVWWWGDGYPDWNSSPYPLVTRDQLIAQVEAEFGPLDSLVVEARDSE
jgi:hypothetical protein